MEHVERLSPKHQFTNQERAAILAEYETCLEMGEKSALCRRVGVNRNTVNMWARQKRDGLWTSLEGKQNSHMMKHRDRVDYERLKRENTELKAKLEKTESVVEVLGKASALLEALAKSAALPEQETEQTQIPPAFLRPKPDDDSSKPQ